MGDRRISESIAGLAGTAARQLSPAPPGREVIAARTGIGDHVPPVPAGGGGGGFASPLTETAYADRVSFPANYITTSDGMFTVQCLQKIKFTDANSNVLWLEFKAP